MQQNKTVGQGLSENVSLFFFDPDFQVASKLPFSTHSLIETFFYQIQGTPKHAEVVREGKVKKELDRRKQRLMPPTSEREGAPHNIDPDILVRQYRAAGRGD